MFPRTRNPLLLLMILCLMATLLAPACAPKSSLPVAQPQTQGQQESPEALAFKAVTVAFDAYDLGMISLRTLQKAKIITQAQFDSAKKAVAWPLYNAIVAAEKTAQAYSTGSSADKQSLYGKMTAALTAVAGSQKEFTALVGSLQGGK